MVLILYAVCNPPLIMPLHLGAFYVYYPWRCAAPLLSHPGWDILSTTGTILYILI